MEIKSKKMISFTVLASFIILGLVLLNGCKKSEPAVSEPATGMGSMSHDMTQPNAVTTDMTVHAAAANEQTICPVMGEPINKDVFVEYQGKKVYFCCADCESEFLKNPEKYVAKLPQFTK